MGKAPSNTRRLFSKISLPLLAINAAMAIYVDWSFFRPGGLYGRTRQLEGWAAWGFLAALLAIAFSFFSRGILRLVTLLVGFALVYLWIFRFAAWT
jgi:hypothetical protein